MKRHADTRTSRMHYAIVLVAMSTLVCAAVANAQRGPIHYFHAGDLPPGTVGQGQLLRGGPLPGYFQPVEVRVPDGASVSFVSGGQFEPLQKGPAIAGMLIGQVYRLKITGIPRNEGFEIYPTIEVVNRLYPPPGQETRFPIPIQFTAEELELALSGRYVTRVIYLEDPHNALPIAEDPKRQSYYEVRPDEDALQAADRLGRPMAIMRMGSRVPDEVVSGRFLYGSPPLLKLKHPAPLPGPRSGLEEPIAPPAADGNGNIPRIDLPGQSNAAARRGQLRWYR